MGYYLNFFLPEFRYGGFPIRDDGGGDGNNNEFDFELVDIVSNEMSSLFEDEFKLYSKIASSFSSLLDDKYSAIYKNLGVGYPGFQIQYSTIFYQSPVFTKHIDWIGLDFEMAERFAKVESGGGGKEANVVSEFGPLIAGVIPIELPDGSGGGLDWVRYKYDRFGDDDDDCLKGGKFKENCIDEIGRTEYTIGDAVFYSFPTLHALAPWEYMSSTAKRIVVVAFFSYIGVGKFLMHPHPLRIGREGRFEGLKEMHKK